MAGRRSVFAPAGRPRTVIELYQAEWCQLSSAVRERLTELGVDFVARQVPPWPEQRVRLVDVAGVDSIPVLVAEDGTVLCGVREILPYLDGLEGWEYAKEHRAQAREHVAHRSA